MLVFSRGSYLLYRQQNLPDTYTAHSKASKLPEIIVGDDLLHIPPSVLTSVAVLGEISLRSPRKLFIFIIRKFFFMIKVSKKQFNLILKKASLVLTAQINVNHVRVDSRCCSQTTGKLYPAKHHTNISNAQASLQ